MAERRTPAGGEATPARTRVAILGAGPAGLAAAFGLSDTPELRARYEVTVYQVGWRAGGKVRSGRQGPEQRVRQNGTHYLFGCYANSFALVRKAYRELQQAGEPSFGTYEEAFQPLSFMSFKQRFRGAWHDWPLQIPTNREMPGAGVAVGFCSYLSMGLQMLVSLLFGWRLARAIAPAPPFSHAYRHPAWWRRWLRPLRRFLAHGIDAVADRILRLFLLIARAALGRRGGDALRSLVVLVLRGARAVWGWLLAAPARRFLRCSRLWMMVDLGSSLAIGLLVDRAFAPGGLAALDALDYRAWLAAHGCDQTTLAGPLVTAWYDSIASYDDGDSARPTVSAGASICAILHAALVYRGAFAFQPLREVGETMIAPLYELLRRRGVRFAFFQRVRELIPENGNIERIRMERQARTRDGDPFGYRPLYMVEGRPAWPDHPLYDQLEDRHALEGEDLESFYTTFRGEDHELVRGQHFDLAVYALPVDSIPFYCPRIVEEQPSWQQMVRHVRGVDTRSLWLYFRPDRRQLGWRYPETVLTAFTLPYATWEDTTYLAACEGWPASETPGMIASLFGPLTGPVNTPPPDHPGPYPEHQRQVTHHSALEFVEQQAYLLWPAVRTPAGGFDWDLLVDLEHRSGPARFDFQQTSANFGPIERYTLALPGALGHRLAADESSYRNLFLAGDWIRNGGDIACIEGAVAGGLEAAIAICGEGKVLGRWPDTGL